MYTLRMPLTSATTFPLTSSKIIIDWSRIAGNTDSVDAPGEDVEQRLIAWVVAHPKRSDVCVVFGGYRNHQPVRKLHSRLQALGCTVIARHVARG